MPMPMPISMTMLMPRCRCRDFQMAIKKDTLTQVFSCEFCETFMDTFFTDNLRTTASAYFYNVIMFFKIGVLKNFTNFTGKHLCWDLFLGLQLY